MRWLCGGVRVRRVRVRRVRACVMQGCALRGEDTHVFLRGVDRFEALVTPGPRARETLSSDCVQWPWRQRVPVDRVASPTRL